MFVKKLFIDKTVEESSYTENFTLLKKKLNTEKDNFKNVSLKDYEKVLKQNNPYYELVQILKKKLNNQYITNAYIKMREIIIYFQDKLPLTKDVTGFHAAEFPGSFIICFQDYCKEKKINYTWLANSYIDNKKSNYLNDRYGLFKEYPTNWMLGAYGNGDVTRLDNIRSIKQDITNFPIIFTGDAKVVIDDNWDNEEIDNIAVVYSETLLALTLLKMKGSAIIKLFTFCEEDTIFTIYNIFKHFDETYITKPLTSRPGNDEVYLVCIGKNKEFDESALYEISDCPFVKVPKADVPGGFVKTLYKIQEELINDQIEALKKNLSLKIISYDKNVIDDWIKVNYGEVLK